jgi:ribulose-5-phosphate 4-epimerase/fuculose-1-phosphate aldolase
MRLKTDPEGEAVPELETIDASVARIADGPGLGLDPTPRQELALVARVLARAGYDDYLAGHLTYRQPDDTILTNPFAIPWRQLRSSEVCRLDLDGNHLEGPYISNPAVLLHLQWHRRRQDLTWTCHNHPRWGTIWASVHRVPPCYNQSSALVHPVILVSDYSGQVSDPNVASEVVSAMGDSAVALLANHGVLLAGTNPNELVTRAVYLEYRCQSAWHVESLSGGVVLDDHVAESLQAVLQGNGGGFKGLWQALGRREYELDSSVLD